LKARAEGRFLYCGRGCYGWPASPLANIIRTDDGQAYIEWLCDRIDARDPAVWQAMRSIRKDSVLACWCPPKPVHGDPLWQVWREYGCIPCRRCGYESTFGELCAAERCGNCGEPLFLGSWQPSLEIEL